MRYVEAVYEVTPPVNIAATLGLAPPLIALTCTVALLLVYRSLRRHFHSFTRIASNLVGHSEQLAQELDELRICDARDAVSESWNRLIDLTVSLEEEVARSTASQELVTALSRSRTGELADAMTAVPLGVVLVSQDNRVLYANRMAARLTGWPGGGEYNLEAEGTTAEGRTIAEAFRSCTAAGGSSRSIDRQVEAADGSYYHVQIVPVRGQPGAGGPGRFIVLILDVSQQVRAEAAREEFVSQVTHELRTPLTNIRAYAETLSSGMFDDPKVITECYNVITKETRRLSRLVEDILSISQLEVGSMQLVFDDVDLRALLTDAVRDVRGIAESKSIDLQLVLPAKLEPIHADRDKLAVVVNNLLGNALKYTRTGGQVVLSCKTADEKVLISVKDTGIGVDPKDQERIFEKFQRAADPDVQSETGTGIGLTTAREIARQHGGDINLVSKKGEGSTFTVAIPVGARASIEIGAAG